MSKFRLKSDLHGYKEVLIYDKYCTESKDVNLVLCGDICEVGKGTKLLEYISTFCSVYKNVLYVTGNHEYYTRSIGQVNKSIVEMQNTFSNFHFLNDSSVVIDDVLVIGGTLWTDFNKADSLSMFYAENGMNDYRYIRTGPDHEPWKRKLSTNDVLNMHRNSVKYIFDAISTAREQNPEQKILVMTHHAPSTLSLDERYGQSVLNPAFASNLEELILDSTPNVWCHGHIHCHKDYYLGDTRIIANPLGHGSEQGDYVLKKDFEI